MTVSEDISAPGWACPRGAAVSFLAISPDPPGERDAPVELHQSDVVVVELGHVPVLEGPDVVLRVNEHLLGNRLAVTWEANKLLVVTQNPLRSQQEGEKDSSGSAVCCSSRGSRRLLRAVCAWDSM